VEAAAGTGDRPWHSEAMTLRDNHGVNVNRLTGEADRDSKSGSSTMEVQSGFLLVVFGAWTEFLGLLALVAVDVPFPKMLGAAALICGLVIALVGLTEVVRDTPGGWTPAAGTSVERTECGERNVAGPIPVVTIQPAESPAAGHVRWARK
jgi:hypothetical protein